MVDPSLLPTFVAVYEAGSISGASRQLYVSQPTVTARISRLEEEMGAPLFVRRARGVTPTAEAERLLIVAKEIARLLEKATVTHDQLGPLELAASTTIASHVLPLLLARFRVRFPDVAIRVDVGNTREVIAAVRDADVPLGLVEGSARAARVRLTPFLDDAIVPVAAKGARYDSREDLKSATILWREPGSGTRAVVARALKEAEVRARPATQDIVLGSTSAILAAAAAGLGVAFLSRHTLASVEGSKLKALPGLSLDIARTFHWAVPAGGLSGTARRFHDFAQREAN